MISKELLSEILKEYKFPFSYEYNTYNDYTKKIYFYVNSELKIDFFSINIYELAHKNLKEWAKLKSVFDIIDWSEEPEQIFKKAEELRNEIN